MTRISKHMSYAEATRSETARRLGLKNDPPTNVLDAMRVTAEMVFEPARKHFGVPMYISSFYRSAVVNSHIGGSTNSQHCTGHAIDIDADVYGGITNTELFEWLRKNVEFDQLIWEFSNPDGTPAWVHVSYNLDNNRGQVLKAYKVNNQTKYKRVMKEKKSFWDTAVGGILKKVAPSAIDLVGDVVPGGKLLKTIFNTEIEKSSLSAVEKEEARLDFEKALKEYELREREMLLRDVADARDMQKAALAQGDLFSKRFVYYLAGFIMLAIAAFVVMLFFVEIPEGNNEIVYMAFGIFMGIGTSVAAFFFGSSQGSKDKEHKLLGMK